jgi:hypothetical protein
MKFYLATTFALIALASADVSQLGYSAGSGVSGSGANARFGGGSSGGFGAGGSSGGFGAGGSSGGFGAGGSSGGFGGSPGSSVGFGAGNSAAARGYGAAISSGPASLQPGNSGYLDYSTGGSNGPATIVKPVVHEGEPVVSKSFFVHEAPVEEPEGVLVQEKPHIVHPRKHYNVIFIKTPLAGGSSISNNNVNVFPENEEKTIVYVLTGRNDAVATDGSPDIQLPPPRPPTKPEVVFVKYNNEQDAQRAISEIQANYNNQQGASVSILGADGSLGAGGFGGSGNAGGFGGSGNAGGFGGSGNAGGFGGARSGANGAASGVQPGFSGSNNFNAGSSYDGLNGADQFGLRRNQNIQNAARSNIRQANYVRRIFPQRV